MFLLCVLRGTRLLSEPKDCMQRCDSRPRTAEVTEGVPATLMQETGGKHIFQLLLLSAAPSTAWLAGAC
jgi:hypothetical protein